MQSVPFRNLYQEHPVLHILAPLDLALTYALRRPKLALSLLREALSAAIRAKRPDYAYQINALIIVVAA